MYANVFAIFRKLLLQMEDHSRSDSSHPLEMLEELVGGKHLLLLPQGFVPGPTVWGLRGDCESFFWVARLVEAHVRGRILPSVAVSRRGAAKVEAFCRNLNWTSKPIDHL